MPRPQADAVEALPEEDDEAVPATDRERILGGQLDQLVVVAPAATSCGPEDSQKPIPKRSADEVLGLGAGSSSAPQS